MRYYKPILGVLLTAILISSFAWIERIRMNEDPRSSLRILDEQGVLLAQEDNAKFGARTWVSLEHISPKLIDAVLNQEDRHFYEHHGIDPRGLGRALLANLHAGHLSQGGSTITQQLAKVLVENYRGQPASRNLFWKGIEALVALDCEVHWSKSEILERYLNEVYLGHRLYGVEAASQAYFGKSAQDLQQDEAEALATHLRRPNQSRALFGASASIPLAPHLLAMFQDAPSPNSGDRVIHTTLDASLQAMAQRGLQRGIERLRLSDPQIQGAVVVIDVEKSELKALVGSEDFSDAEHQGQVNHALALRQPGSTMKPFTYFLAFLHHRRPADLVLDAPYHFYLGNEKSYTPNNYDRRFHGVMAIREALGNSLNIPAVLTLEDLGTTYYLELLHHFGFASLDQSASFYGLAITLGSGAVSLVELTNGYAALARGGTYRPLTLRSDAPVSAHSNPSTPVHYGEKEEKQAAFLVTSILSDPEARRHSFGDADLMGLEGKSVAVKTGTSHGSRDAWAVGYTSHYAVGVWMGHSDNSPMPGFSGAEAAIPVWHSVMAGLNKGEGHEDFAVPEGLSQKTFCRDEHCQVVKVDWSPESKQYSPQVAQPHETFRFITPVDGDKFLLDSQMPKDRQQIFCEVRLPAELKSAARANAWNIRWLVDNEEVATSPFDQPKTFLQLPPGKHELKAMVGSEKTHMTRLTVSSNEGT